MRTGAADSEDDFQVIAQLWRGYGDYLRDIDCYDLGGETIEPELAALAKHYPPEDGGIYLATQPEKKVALGTIALNRLNGNTGELRRLYVPKAHQGQGLGKKLILHAMAQARRIGYCRLLLDTFRNQPGPQRLYKSLGFQECPPYNSYPVDKMMFFEMEL